jgi:hypothetical protein
MQHDFEQLGKLLPASWHTLIGRSLVTLEAYIKGSPETIFFQRSFIEGVAQQQKEGQTRLGKVFGSAMAASLITLFFDKVVVSDFSIMSVPTKLLSGLHPLVHLAGAFANYALVIALLDLLFITLCLTKIFNSAGLYHSSFFLMNVNANGVWADIYTPRFFGTKTGIIGKTISLTIGCSVILITLAATFFPMAINIYYSYYSFGASEANWVLSLADAAAMGVTCLSILIFILATMVPFPYRESFLREGPPREDFFEQEKAEAALMLKEVLKR